MDIAVVKQSGYCSCQTKWILQLSNKEDAVVKQRGCQTKLSNRYQLYCNVKQSGYCNCQTNGVQYPQSGFVVV